VHLVPPTILVDTPSDGEKRIFELLAADSAYPDWTALHSHSEPARPAPDALRWTCRAAEDHFIRAWAVR